jgi:hypothetical protein
MKRLLVTLGVLVVSAAAAHAAGCSAAGTNVPAGAGGAGAAGTGSNTGGSSLAITVTGAGGGASCTGPHCSSDLHSLVDCDGHVISTCPADQGCTPTGCVDACAAAVANQSNVGCEYFAVDPDVVFDGAGACYAAYIVNTWTTPVTITADYDGMTLDPSTFGVIPTGSGQSITYTPIQNAQIPAGQVAILFLNRFPGLPTFLQVNCPAGITPAITSKDAATHGTSTGHAFHLTASAPVVAYDIFPYGGGASAMTSATMLLPTSAWDTNYVAVDAFGSNPIDAPFVEIVAQSDNTMVTINPTSDIAAAGGVAGTTKGTPQTYTVNKGEVLQFTQANSLAGSVIQSTAPIGVWGGQSAISIEACCDDTAHQQIPPVRAMGHEYAAVRYRNRYDGIEESPPWRMVGAVNGTQLTYEPKAPKGAPATLDLGQVAQFDAAGPFLVYSQDADHPFYMSAHMTGGALYDPATNDPNATPDGRGDAEFVNIVPPAEFLTSYVFFTDPTYPETNLVVIRAKGGKGFSDVILDCAGPLSGWQPIGTSGQYEYTRTDLVRHNFAPQGNCNTGRHEIKSDSPFGLTIWGWGSADTGQMFMGFYSQYVSYAYPAGAGVQAINTVVIPPTTK